MHMTGSKMDVCFFFFFFSLLNTHSSSCSLIRLTPSGVSTQPSTVTHSVGAPAPGRSATTPAATGGRTHGIAVSRPTAPKGKRSKSGRTATGSFVRCLRLRSSVDCTALHGAAHAQGLDELGYVSKRCHSRVRHGICA
ncbi:hypothetical protein LY78DRAFT_377623 [Colletotrichum sublineola]|nr:hypothetical protein LY78DRAFT_377623 [Colletotrichum sublineola]